MKKILFFVCCFLIIFNVNAKNISCKGDYSAILNLLNDSIYINDTTKLTVTKTEENLNYIVKYEVLSGNEFINIKDNEKSLQITGKKMGVAKIKISLQLMDGTNSKGICTSEFELKILSSDVTLKSLNTAEYDISKLFKNDIYEYTIEIPYEIEKINITAIPTDPNASVTGDGERYLNEGIQSFMILVNNNGEKNSYKINVKRLEASNDATLKNLTIDGFLLNPSFNKNTFEYSLNVDNNVTEIKVSAEANNQFAIVNGIGTFKLATGINTLLLNVQSQSGQSQNYYVKIKKSKGTSLLRSLKVSRYKLDEKFNRNKFVYNIRTYDDISSVKIIAEASSGDKIEIIGNENLKLGRNEIYIKVYGEDKTASVYKLNFFKLNSNDLINGIGSSTKTLSKVLFIIFLVSIIITILFILLFLKRNYGKSLKKSKSKKKAVK